MKIKFKRPRALRDIPTHYCPGCGHGIIHRLVAEIVEELNIRERTIGIAPVGCAVLAYDYWDFDCSEAAHGRVLAVATGIKRCRPDCVVFTYQGDGDLAAIGTAETIHAANRAENLTCIFVNNAVYGMSGGQMAPTTVVGQKTTTTPSGRDPHRGEGYPLRIIEMLALLKGVVYADRVCVASPSDVVSAKKAIKQAFVNQIEGKGFSIVEVLSQCPTIWRMLPENAVKWVKEEMVKFYPLGRIK